VSRNYRRRREHSLELIAPCVEIQAGQQSRVQRAHGQRATVERFISRPQRIRPLALSLHEHEFFNDETYNYDFIFTASAIAARRIALQKRGRTDLSMICENV
jgi:hypothetical protein